MKHASYEEVFEIVKDNGPITLGEVGKILVKKNRFTQEEFDQSIRSEIAGYLGSLYKNSLIEKTKSANEAKISIRKTRNIQNRWRLKEQVNGLTPSS